MQPVDTPPQQHGCSLTSCMALILMIAGACAGYSLGKGRGIGYGLLGIVAGTFAGVIATGLLLSLVALLVVALGGRDTPNEREESHER